jgi:hypothetical protein
MSLAGNTPKCDDYYLNEYLNEETVSWQIW